MPNISYDKNYIKNYIKQNEGFRDTVYLDTKDIPTIGYGYNLTESYSKIEIESLGYNYNNILSGSQTLSNEAINILLDNAVERAVDDAKQFVSNFDELSSERQTVLIDMAYNMGRNKLNQFQDLKEAIEAKNWDNASKEILDSKYHYEDVPNRAKENSNIMKTGSFDFEDNDNNQTSTQNNSQDNLPPISSGDDISNDNSTIPINITDSIITNIYEGGYGTIIETTNVDGSITYQIPNENQGIDIITIDKNGQMVDTNEDLNLLLQSESIGQDFIGSLKDEGLILASNEYTGSGDITDMGVSIETLNTQEAYQDYLDMSNVDFNVNLQDNQYDIKISVNDDGTRVYEFSTEANIKNIGDAKLSFKMTEDTYGNFVAASGSGTISKDFKLADFTIEAGGECIVEQSYVMCNLEAKANLDLTGDDFILSGDTSLEVSSFKIQAQIPIEDLQNKNLDNLEISSKASVAGVSTDGAEVWAQNTQWDEWQSMSPEQQAQARHGGYGPLTKNWSESLNHKIDQYNDYMQNIVGGENEGNIVDYFDGTSAVLKKDNGDKIVFHRVDSNTSEKYVLNKDGSLKSYEIKNENGEYQKFEDSSLIGLDKKEVEPLFKVLNNNQIEQSSLENSINNIDTSNLNEPSEVGIVSLSEGQTISHVAQDTPYNSIELLEYNNLTLEQAKSLPVGFEVQIPKSVNTYNGMKVYESHNGEYRTTYTDTDGNKQTYFSSESETSVLKIEGDISNPNKIELINPDGKVQAWERNENGEYLEVIDASNISTGNINETQTAIDITDDTNTNTDTTTIVSPVDNLEITDVSYNPDSQILTYTDELGNQQQLTYTESSDLLIYGDPSNPDKITFTDPESGEYQEWGKDKDGNYVRTDTQAYGEQIGSTIGSQIGSLIIANNDFSNIEKILVSTATTTVAQNIGEYLESGNEEANDDMGADAVGVLVSAAVSFAVSEYFAKNDNISDILGMDGTFVGGMADTAVMATTAYVATTYVNGFISGGASGGASAVSSAFTQTTTASGVTYTPAYSMAAGAVGAYVGNALANEIMDWDTKAEAQGAAIGSAVSLMALFIATGPVGWVAGFFYALGASFIGNIVGGILGGLFGGGDTPPPPEAKAYLEFNEESLTYTLISSSSQNGGNEAALKNIGESLGKQFVNMFMIPGGQLVEAAGMPEIYMSQKDQLVKLNSHKGSFDSVNEMMAQELALQLPFINVENGDPYVLRAMNRLNEEGFESLEEFYEVIELAQEYSSYMNEVTIIVDSEGNKITDRDTLLQIDEEYKAINTIEDEDEKTQALEEFNSKYQFISTKEYVDGLLEEITDEDIQNYLQQRDELEKSFDTPINANKLEIENINKKLESLESSIQILNYKIRRTESDEAMEKLQIEKEALLSQKNSLTTLKTELLEENKTLEEEKTEAIEQFDNEHSKETQAIHWKEVFSTAEELRLDEHHYSEDFTKLNNEIAKFNYKEAEENGELLEVDHKEYLEQVAFKMLEIYTKEDKKENLSLEDTEEVIEEETISKAEALEVLKELGYDLEAGYEGYMGQIPQSDTNQGISFEEFLSLDNTLDISFQEDTLVEVTPERFEELLELAEIESPYENLEPLEDAFSFRAKSLNDLQFELNNGALTITTFDKDLSLEEASELSQNITIEDFDKWSKKDSFIDLPNGTKINLDALLTKIGVVDGGGKVDVNEAFASILAEDETIEEYLDKYDINNIYLDTDSDDKITAYFNDSLIISGEGDDTILTGSGDDILLNGAGKDTINLGLGEDTVSYEKSTSGIQASLREGGTFGDAQGDSYIDVENLTGTNFDDYLKGDSNSNTLKGLDGNDILAGGQGADTLDGGEGIDLASYSNSDTNIEVNLDNNFSSDGDSFINIEGVQATDYNDTVVGDTSANIVYANSGDDRVSTGSGDDILHGGEGDDYLKGDSGNDTLYAGTGDDILIGGTGDDILYSDEGKNTLLGGSGKDIVVYKGDSSEYQIMFFDKNTIFVKSIDGKTQDTLKNIEELAFDDGVFSIDYENQTLVKKATFENPEEVTQESEVQAEANNPATQAAVIAAAAMIGTVATAQTLETSEFAEDYIGVEDNNDEAVVEVQEEQEQIILLNENDPIYEQIQTVIKYEDEKKQLSNNELIEDNNTNTQISESNNNIATENDQKQNEVAQGSSFASKDVDTNVEVDLQADAINEEEVEDELPILLVPVINFETTTVDEDNILSGILISNPNPNSSISVIISGLPDDVMLNNGDKQANGDWNLLQPDLQGLELIPALHDANDFEITVKATVVDIHGRVIQNTFISTITIVAVADEPNFAVVEQTSGDEDTFIDLDISTSLVDTVGGADGEESIILGFENVPDDAILSAGRKDATSGIWYLTPDQLEGLQVKAGTHVGDDFTITVTSYAIESENGSVASVSEDIFVEVVAVADTPTLDVNNAQTDEDTPIVIDIESELVDMDGSEVISVKIENIPDGAVLNKGYKDADGNWHLTKPELENLILTPPLHDSDDFTMVITARTTESENGSIAEITKELDVVIDAVADNVTLDLTQELTGEERILGVEDASIVFLDIASEFIDTDGSESIHYIVEGIPEGASLNNGTEIEAGKWEVQTSQLDRLGIFLKENSDKDFKLKISAITTEAENSHQETTVKYIDCIIESDADFAKLEVTNTSGYQNEYISLDIESGLIDTDGSESLQIVIEQVPDKAVLSSGTKDSDGKWHLSVEDLKDLTIRPEFNSLEDIELKISAITTEAKNGDQQVNTAYLNVDVQKIPSNDSLIINATEVLEDETCTLDIQIDRTKLKADDYIYLEVEIPEGLSLSAGKQLNSTTWKVRENELENLSINTPVNYAGSFMVNIIPTIIGADGNVNISTITSKLPVDIVAVADTTTLEFDDITSNEDQIVYLNLQSELSDLDGSESLHLEIKGLPDDGLLNVGQKQGDSWIIEEKDIELVGFIPPQDFSGDLNLEIKSVATDSNGDTNETLKNMSITINEVIDTPIITMVDSFINETEANLILNVQLRDSDGSENLNILIDNLPENAVLNNGILNDDGSYTLSKEDLTDLKIENLSGEKVDLDVQVEVNGQTINKTLTINSLEDFVPNLFDTNDNNYTNLIQTIDTLDPNSTIEIKIDGIPSNSILDQGIKNNDGTYTLTKEMLEKVKISNADNQQLNLDIEIKEIVVNSFDPIDKDINITVDNDTFTLYDNSSYSSQYDLLIDEVDGKAAMYQLSGIPEGITITPSGVLSDGIYTLTQEELEQVVVNDYSGELDLNIKAVIEDEVITNISNEILNVDILETRETPYMNISNLSMVSTTENGDNESFSDASDNIYSGGSNDILNAQGGNDLIYSDQSNGTVDISFNLTSTYNTLGNDEKIVYKIESLPLGTVVNTGYIDNGVLILEKENFDGVISLSIPYQTEKLDLNVTTNIVNENDIDTSLSIANTIIEIESRDITGLDYIDAGEGNDVVDSGEKDDIVKAGAGDDIVFAKDGNDYIHLGSGKDRVDAGDGDDIIVMDADDFKQSLFINEIVNGGEGYDTVVIQDTQGVNFNMELTNVEKFVGGEGNDNIIGSDNSDLVYGGKGADTYLTGDGNDTIYIDKEDLSANSSSFIDTGDGNDTIYIDEERDVEFDVGNSNSEKIISGSGDDILKNSSNSDISIFGMDGNDTIFASDGIDVLDGGDGIDTVDFSNSIVGVNVNLEDSTLSSGYAQGDTINNFENIVGTNSDDNLIGDSNDNILTALGGNDTIDGGDGEDTAVFDGSLLDYYKAGSIVTGFDSTATVFTIDGINELTNIEKLQFDDYVLYIDGKLNNPFVYDDSAQTQEDTSVTVSINSLLDNDFSIENSALEVIGIGNSENGVARFNSDGTITFTPNKDYNSTTNNQFDKNSALYKGDAGFEYIVEDENGNRSTSFVSVNVSAVNDTPTIESHNFSRRGGVSGHGKFVVNDVDSDVSGMDVKVVSSLTYETTGGMQFVWNNNPNCESFMCRFSWEQTRFTRTGYTNIANRTPNDDGVFEFDYRGSYIGGHYYNTGGYDVVDMRPFTLQITDNGDPLTGNNQLSVFVQTGVYVHMLLRDPIVIDLDGDGIEIEEKYYELFDETFIGVNKDDAVLVWDIDGNGTISSELETNWVSLAPNAKNDLDALREIFDTNKDGLFNEEDTNWAEFGLWQDINEDGLVNDGEFTSIIDSDIVSLNLETIDRDDAARPIVELASYTNKEEEINEIAAAYLDTTTTEEKLSDEDILVLQQAIKLNEQLACSNNIEQEVQIVIEENFVDEDQLLEENIA